MSQECIICLDDNYTENNHSICYFSDKCSCNPIVHKNCIKTWINTNSQNRNKCPVCRTTGELLPIDTFTGNILNVSLTQQQEIPQQPEINDIEIQIPIYNNNLEDENINNQYECNSFCDFINSVFQGFILLIRGFFYLIYLIFYYIFIGLGNCYNYITETQYNQEQCKKLFCFCYFIITSIFIIIGIASVLQDENYNI